MNLAWIMAVSVALGADAFSLALAIGLVRVSKRLLVRLSLTVAGFHVVMPLMGLFAGQKFGLMFGTLAKGAGAIVLIWLGIRMIQNAYRPSPEHLSFSEAKETLFRKKLPQGVSLKGWGIFALAGSVSLDALSVGFSLGTAGSQIGFTVLTMGAVAGIMTGSGLLLGRFVGTWIGEKAEAIGGLTLAIIGMKLFF